MTPSATLNIGILAHVDAGKTSLTERLLYEAGSITRLGSVDGGDTRTDTGRIERERGITVRTAVAAFRSGNTQVNLVDTPGHTDFVAEVERALGVLDGVVLVLSAVEGVQPHTRLLMRVLREARMPVVLFVNKIDRSGARPEHTDRIRRSLSDRVLPLDTVWEAGTHEARVVPHDWTDPALADRAAETLAEHDDDLLAALVEERPLPGPRRLRRALRDQTTRGLVHPVLSGSAITGEGVPALTRALIDLFPATPRSETPEVREPHGTVFAIERSASGEKTGYVRLYGGTLTPRQHTVWERADPTDGAPHEGRVTGLEVIGTDKGPCVLTAGGIGRVRGLPGLRVGDRMGPSVAAPRFTRPALEATARPLHEVDASRLHSALTALAEQDPLIGLRTIPGEGMSVLLQGEVQKEVIADTLAADFGVRAVFAPSSTVYAERPAGTGTEVWEVDAERRFGPWATVGLRVEAAPWGSGVRFRREVELGALPLSFDRAIEETVYSTLAQGLYGWAVTDCTVTLVRSGLTPSSTAADYRALSPVVLMRALDRAGTRVYEPLHRCELELPAEALGQGLSLLSRHGARVDASSASVDGMCRVTGEIPAGRVYTVRTELPGLTQGEAVWLSRPSGERPTSGAVVPRRVRTDGNPLDPEEYLVHLTNKGHATTG